MNTERCSAKSLKQWGLCDRIIMSKCICLSYAKPKGLMDGCMMMRRIRMDAAYSRQNDGSQSYCCGQTGDIQLEIVNERVSHRKYGEGTIVSYDKNGHIQVRFDLNTRKHTFAYPSCFVSHLVMLNKRKANAIARLNEKLAETDEAKAEKKHRDAMAKMVELQKKYAKIEKERHDELKNYSTVEEFLTSFSIALSDEIEASSKQVSKRQKLFDGHLLGRVSSGFIYRFEADTVLNLPDSIQISLYLSEPQLSGYATIINCDGNRITFSTGLDLGQNLQMIQFSSEPLFILAELLRKMDEMLTDCSPICRALMLDGLKMVKKDMPFQTESKNARKMAINQPITFIWGPPGTGKTETLARITLDHLQMKHSVLMLSYSNVSVDSAILRTYEKDPKKAPGRLIRYGYPRDRELIDHDYLSSYNLAMYMYPELAAEYACLEAERERLSSEGESIRELTKMLNAVSGQIHEAEDDLVYNASFIATTLSKAIVDPIINGRKYDVVIVDEASMALIPQIIFAASLASMHFICIGDFSQLPPIVLAKGKSILNDDIFTYCGLVSAVRAKCRHEWLCMLDTQYRMHPEIASFASEAMYAGLLKTKPDVIDERQMIADAAPFAGDAMRLVDLSGMLSVCKRTPELSRVNPLSGLISMGLAIRAAEKHEVGVIVPYSAQAHLLSALSLDIWEQCPNLKRITCATVHQFQGSERDVIIYDAVDCFRMKRPGVLLTDLKLNSANRLFNVAMTRTRGKLITVANVDFLDRKNFSSIMLFSVLMTRLRELNRVSEGNEILAEADNSIIRSFLEAEAQELFLEDIHEAKEEIAIDLPGGCQPNDAYYERMANEFFAARRRGVRITIRTDDKSLLPKQIRSFSVVNNSVICPLSIIDRECVWHGMPLTSMDFISMGEVIPTRYRPIFRIRGRNFARSLYSYMEMSHNNDLAPLKGRLDEERHTAPLPCVLRFSGTPIQRLSRVPETYL